ncbi:hypothetical protein BDP27DRAFT_1417222 [Rhodocollybia butyracea]|uniref:Uncharacterized protein n=1 Tax=Rhodocollybia butyracea TaxID=206335 RepID=A0A9P5Q4G1_9AGAR|nr:hypothetical protein BDP27DRAFT_1417222 [Rhodocollybia butyracea]
MSLPSSRSSSCSPSTDLSFDLPLETLDATKVPTGTRVLELATSFQFGSSMGFDFDSSFLRASSSPLILAPSPETHTVPLNSEDQHACPDKTCGPSQSPAPSCHRSPKVKKQGTKARCQSSDEDYEDADDSEEDDYDPHGCNSATGRKRNLPTPPRL